MDEADEAAAAAAAVFVVGGVVDFVCNNNSSTSKSNSKSKSTSSTTAVLMWRGLVDDAPFDDDKDDAETLDDGRDGDRDKDAPTPTPFDEEDEDDRLFKKWLWFRNNVAADDGVVNRLLVWLLDIIVNASAMYVYMYDGGDDGDDDDDDDRMDKILSMHKRYR